MQTSSFFPSMSTDRSKAVPLLQFCFICASMRFIIWRLFCQYLYQVPFVFGASGRLRFVTVVYPRYLNLYLFNTGGYSYII